MPGQECPQATAYPLPCRGGHYCGTNSGTVTGPCQAGYYCIQNATTPTPTALRSNGTLGTLLGDKCPTGNYCPQASIRPIACPVGTFSGNIGNRNSSQCMGCPGGFWCPNFGMTAPLHCPGGFICNSTSFFVCPAGYQCPTGRDGNRFSAPCLPGTYQNEMNSTSCITCPAGYMCPEVAATAMTICPEQRYCPPATAVPPFCKNGTYGTVVGQKTQSDCTLCPNGQFCSQGLIQGNCSSGYFCKAGQSSGTPIAPLLTSLLNQVTNLLAYLESLPGAPCPPGRYCPSGTSDPLICPNGTFRGDPYGAHIKDCGPCQAGLMCINGDPAPEKCPKGEYCEVGKLPQQCPLYTYNPYFQQGTITSCLACPAGYFCNAKGISNLAAYTCPAGSFCLQGTRLPDKPPISCPAGTYRPFTNGTSLHDCLTCPKGKYCPFGSKVYFPCPPNNYCPSGSSNGTICTGGGYCPANSSLPITCPSSYYCPMGVSKPIPCYRGSYCPTGTVYPIPCPLGYAGAHAVNNTLSVLGNIGTACTACPAGTYGTDPQVLYYSRLRTSSLITLLLYSPLTPVPYFASFTFLSHHHSHSHTQRSYSSYSSC